MAKKTVSIRANVDGTLTVKVGRHIEHVRYAWRDKSEVWDAVRYALISKGISINDVDLIELLDAALAEAGQNNSTSG